MAEVRLEGLTKTYDRETAVDDVDLTVRDGEILGVVGPSGCGKTTTLRTIAGFETPTAGRVLFDGEDVTHVPPETRNVGLVFQSYALFDNMSVIANVAFGLKMRGVRRRERRDRARSLLELLDIAELADREPATLSGGQQQRVGLARALAIEPSILLLDEPMTGLDASLKERLRSELAALLSDLDVTALYVTHDQEEAMVMCDRIAVLNRGRVEQVGEPAAVYERPANRFVADFVGSSNVVPATVDDGRLDLGFATVPATGQPRTDEGLAVLRPTDFTADGEGFAGTVRDRSTSAAPSAPASNSRPGRSSPSISIRRPTRPNRATGCDLLSIPTPCTLSTDRAADSGCAAIEIVPQSAEHEELFPDA